MKIWTVATDTKDGTESHVFFTEDEFDRFMHDFLYDRWDSHHLGTMPDEWSEAWEAMDCSLGDLDSFTCDQLDLYYHPVVSEALGALAMAHERLGINNCEGEEEPFISQLETVIGKLTAPKPEEAA